MRYRFACLEECNGLFVEELPACATVDILDEIRLAELKVFAGTFAGELLSTIVGSCSRWQSRGCSRKSEREF